MFFGSQRNWRQYLNIIPAAIIIFSLGLGLGWVAPALVHFASKKSSIPVTTAEISWIASSYFFMELTTPIISGACSTIIGRKPILTLGAVFTVLSWGTVIFAKSAVMIIAARALLGTAAGFHDITWSIYLGEFATPDKRGVLGSIMTVISTAGITLEFLLSLFVPYEMLAIIPFIFSVIGLAWCIFMVESPYYLLKKNNDTDALKNLIWLRGADNAEVRSEFDEIKLYVQGEKRSSLQQFLKTPSEYKLCFLCILLFGFTMFSGYTTITNYMGFIMKQYSGILSGNDLTFLFGFVAFVSINLSPFIIERAGRRIMLTFGFGLSALVQILIASAFYIDQMKPSVVPFIPQLLVVLFIAEGVIFSIFLAPSVYVLKSELFPQDLKTVGSVIATMLNACVQFITLKIFIPIWDSYGIYYNFLIYAVFCMFVTTCVYFLLPETSGRSLTQIQRDNVGLEIQGDNMQAEKRRPQQNESVGVEIQQKSVGKEEKAQQNETCLGVEIQNERNSARRERTGVEIRRDSVRKEWRS